MENSNNLKGWKSDTKPLPEPIEIKLEDIDEKLLVIKKPKKE